MNPRLGALAFFYVGSIVILLCQAMSGLTKYSVAFSPAAPLLLQFGYKPLWLPMLITQTLLTILGFAIGRYFQSSRPSVFKVGFLYPLLSWLVFYGFLCLWVVFKVKGMGLILLVVIIPSVIGFVGVCAVSVLLMNHMAQSTGSWLYRAPAYLSFLFLWLGLVGFYDYRWRVGRQKSTKYVEREEKEQRKAGQTQAEFMRNAIRKGLLNAERFSEVEAICAEYQKDYHAKCLIMSIEMKGETAGFFSPEEITKICVETKLCESSLVLSHYIRVSVANEKTRESKRALCLRYTASVRNLCLMRLVYEEGTPNEQNPSYLEARAFCREHFVPAERNSGCNGYQDKLLK